MEANLWKKLGLMIQLHDDFRLSIFCVISYLYFVLYCKSCKRKVTLKNVSTNWLLELRVVCSSALQERKSNCNEVNFSIW